MIEGLDKMLEHSGLSGLDQLRGLMQELVGGPSVGGTFLGHSNLKMQSNRVFRLRFKIDDGERTWVAKRLKPEVGRRNELAARRWLPAVGLQDAGPALAGSVADTSGTCVWQVYEDLGDHELNPVNSDREAVQAAAELIAQIHTRFAGHALLGEIRLHGGDLGAHFLKSNVRDAIYALESIKADPLHQPTRDRILQRLYILRNELPQRERLLERWGGQETLLHGDLWATNVFISEVGGRLRARLIDWDHVAVGPSSYDVSTFLLRFPPERRQWILDIYCREVARRGWDVPPYDELNSLFETAEYARLANQIIWPAIALAMDNAEWGFRALADVEQWFAKFEHVLPLPGSLATDATA